ncbi:tetratricopeptide (TPR) repeat protein [Pullulanibacillus pueri]|uniref:Tetratricopeptide repeat protein n=1 Tax=Pullulanibacillus pueri TaxID=1437324 RepID=A0A8J3EMS6_9BACL|nr:tetratricopeptide repeat protein [Pullulanibacillus pueri]MBM7682553.1 tetratricopeptide (TPR) repeat protein [Pullulanibacillus pueri]GGH81949.1 hypothetical protein GCM10007096_20600 [Pullulanibacillus pueri]
MGTGGVNKTETIEKTLSSWQLAIIDRETSEADHLKEEIDALLSTLKHTGNIIHTKYHLLNYGYLLLKGNFKLANDILDTLSDQTNQFNQELYFLFHFFKGLHFKLEDERYVKAIEEFQKAENFTEFIKNDSIVAELYYQTGTVFYERIKNFDSFIYIQKAHEIFSKIGYTERIAGCEMLIGLNCMDMHQYEEAERRFYLALKAANKTENTSLKTLAYHDLGLLYGQQNLSKAAIRWLTEAVKLQEDYFKSSFLLFREYCKLNELEKAKEWYVKGIKRCKEVNDQDNLIRFELLYAMYMDTSQFETTFIKGIQHFYKTKLWQYVKEYSVILAQHYRDHGKVQEAIKYYDLFIEADQKIIESEALK